MNPESTRPTRSRMPDTDPPSGPKRRYGGLVWLLIGAFLLAIVVNSGLIYTVVRDLTANYTGAGLNPFRPSGSGGQTTPPPPGEPTPTLSLDVTPQPWDGKSRVTVLVLGLDFRDWEAGLGAPRTDSMMLLTIDPITRTAGMLSIPRDLWVEIPGFRHQRINTAYPSGEINRLPGGGPGLAMRTVEEVVGVPIQYYAVIEFSTFERMIDEIGGIDVYVPQTIKISPIGRLSFWLEGGKGHHLDGAEALAYARVRKGSGSGGDFGRAERQQQVALAIIDRVVGFDMLPTLLRTAPTLYQELSSGVRTNLSLQEIVSLGVLAMRIPRENIRKGVIGPPNMVGFHTTEDGAQVLRPVYDQIRILRDQIFVDTSAIVLPVSELEAATPAP